MKRIDMNLIYQCQGVLHRYGIYMNNADLYDNLLKSGLIYKNGKPTQKSFKVGLISTDNKNDSNAQVLLARIINLEHKYNLMPLKYLDSALHNDIMYDKSVPIDQRFITRIRVDNDIQMTYKSFIILLSNIITQRLLYLDSFIQSGTLDKNGERLMTKNAEQAEQCLHDINSKYPVDYSLFDWWSLILYAKILSLEVMHKEPKKYQCFFKSHMKFIERNFLEQMQKSGCKLDNALNGMQSQVSFAERSYDQFKHLRKGGNRLC